ncbi:NADH-dependent FMN reductase [Virgibacillus profundi]|uniref:NADH-dependent FMN reductase n=1 Tax=Virgibacillus profundi TaxID=2024555 RepID=A0A2A2ICH3_9BACI|nr:NAD(P)H-dependent oxidoreductase [Virgibacillus profundi]PAV28773.1 NADH-dependent FMN reductase [Virgibacillus profundi]PXY52941.1 NADPH-dependent oxidoreductase [Virgibacillus profundi]
MKLVGISGALAGEKTSLAVSDILVAAGLLDSTIKTELIDLRDYEVEFAVGAPLSDYNDDTWDVVNKILSADFLVFGTPIYQASISGALKNLLDHFPENAFKHKVTGIVATGWSNKHFLVTEYQLKPVLSFFKGLVPTGNVFIHNDAFNEESDEIIDQNVSERIQKLANEMIYLQRGINNR